MANQSKLAFVVDTIDRDIAEGIKQAFQARLDDVLAARAERERERRVLSTDEKREALEELWVRLGLLPDELWPVWAVSPRSRSIIYELVLVSLFSFCTLHA